MGNRNGKRAGLRRYALGLMRNLLFPQGVDSRKRLVQKRLAEIFAACDLYAREHNIESGAATRVVLQVIILEMAAVLSLAFSRYMQDQREKGVRGRLSEREMLAIFEEIRSLLARKAEDDMIKENARLFERGARDRLSNLPPQMLGGSYVKGYFNSKVREGKEGR